MYQLITFSRFIKKILNHTSSVAETLQGFTKRGFYPIKEKSKISKMQQYRNNFIKYHNRL